MKYAIQMYTIRDYVKDEQTLTEALVQLKKMGYEGVEFAGFYGIPAERLKKILIQTGMQAIGCHIGIDELENELERVLKDANILGINTVTMSWSASDSPEEVARTLHVLQMSKEAAKSYGIRILYHNHFHELRPVEGVDQLPLMKIMKVVPLEADLYWIFYAGFDPVRFLRENRARIGMIHIKDGKKAEPAPCALGEGEIDIHGICELAKNIGFEWLIVEDDKPVPDGLPDAKRSILALQKEYRKAV